jgi:DNA-binding NarL/FixJ family response regulator
VPVRSPGTSILRPTPARDTARGTFRGRVLDFDRAARPRSLLLRRQQRAAAVTAVESVNAVVQVQLRRRAQVGAAALPGGARGHRAIDHAIRELHAGNVCFSPEVQSRIVIGPSSAELRGGPVARTGMLTKREREVLGYPARAMARNETAQSMHFSPHTVDRHTSSVMRKLDMHDRAALCRFAIREGLAIP